MSEPEMPIPSLTPTNEPVSPSRQTARATRPLIADDGAALSLTPESEPPVSEPPVSEMETHKIAVAPSTARASIPDETPNGSWQQTTVLASGRTSPRASLEQSWDEAEASGTPALSASTIAASPEPEIPMRIAAVPHLEPTPPDEGPDSASDENLENWESLPNSRPHVDDDGAALLPSLPDPEVELAPTTIVPTIPRFGPPVADTTPTPALRVTALGRRRGTYPVWAPYATVATIVLLVATLIAILGPVITRATSQGEFPKLTTNLANDTQTTDLNPKDADFGHDALTIAPDFAAYYSAHNGLVTLGPAITPGFSTNLGETQFFANGALVYTKNATPTAIASAASDNPGDLDPDLARNGADDDTYQVLALPLSQELLALGSKASVGAPDSGLTYTTLRADAQPSAFVVAPSSTEGYQTLEQSGAFKVLLGEQSAFVIEGKRGGKNVGHAIPLAIWSYMTQTDVAPQGWAVNIGEPLTEALSVTGTVNGEQHRLLVQAFAQTILIADLDASQATTTPATTVTPQATATATITLTGPMVTPQPVGGDYLHTFGGPTAHVTPGLTQWLTDDGALRTAAGADTVAIGINTNSQISLTGGARWLGSDLWYAAAWTSLTRHGQAWVNADDLTATQPTGLPVDGFDVLSPDLASYLAGRGGNTGVVAYDVTRGVMYEDNPTNRFIMASSCKVPLMVAYLQWIESQNRGPNGSEVATMTAMIEHSDNNAAQLIYDRLGDNLGPQMHGWGITDYTSDPNGWGWGKWSPGDMAHLLSLLQAGKVLNASDRNLAFNLMGNIESDQQFGVGDSAPSGAQFWMKNGWVTGPDGLWAVNSSGIVQVGKETYIITVYNGELGGSNGFQAGVDIVNHVCGAVGQALK